MITRVEIENFKAIEKLSMDFTSRLTVIVGPNGSGKTSILKSVLLGLKVGNHNANLDGYPFGDVQSNNNVCIQTTTGKIRHTGSDFVYVHGESLPSEKPLYLKINCDRAGAPSRLDELETETLATDGSNLTGLLVELRLNAPEKYEEIQGFLKQIIPVISAIKVNRRRSIREETRMIETDDGEKYPDTIRHPVTVERLLFDTLSKSDIEVSAMSEGTILVLTVLAALINAPVNAVVLIDDIDAALHPSAQARLVATLRQLLMSRPALQVIATTHSPYLLDSLTHDEIRLTTLDDQGRVVCGTLMDHPDFERWKDEMTPGEMWSMFGEKWLTEPKESVPVVEVAT